MKALKKSYSIEDTAQHILGGFLLAGPFVVTEEVWRLAGNMSGLQVLVNVAIVFAIGYAVLYRADKGRDPDSELNWAGIPFRFVSLIGVAYLSAAILAVTFAAPQTFEAGLLHSFKAISVASVFSMLGAATVDSVL